MQCYHAFVFSEPGLDSRTRACGKHGCLLLLLLPQDLCDLLHKDNRPASYPPTQKQPGLAAQTQSFLLLSSLIEQYQQPETKPPSCPLG